MSSGISRQSALGQTAYDLVAKTCLFWRQSKEGTTPHLNANLLHLICGVEFVIDK